MEIAVGFINSDVPFSNPAPMGSWCSLYSGWPKVKDWEPSAVMSQSLWGTLPPHNRRHFLFVLFSGILRCGTTVPTPPSFSWAPNWISGMTRIRLKSWRRRSWLPLPTHRALPWQKRSVWQQWGCCWLDLGCVCGRPCTLHNGMPGFCCGASWEQCC